MQLSDIYICALKKIDGFDDEAILKAIELANNDVVETIEEFIDFVNFNIEENKFPHISQPYKDKIIIRAVEEAINNEDNIVHYLSVTDSNYPQKLLSEQIEALPLLAYRGALKNVERKTIMIIGSPLVTNNAKLASKYLGKIFASDGYNILVSSPNECEQGAILGCRESLGLSSFFLPHSIDYMTNEEKNLIENEVESGRSAIISVSNSPKSDKEAVEDTFRYLTLLADCIIIPQIKRDDSMMKFVENYMAAKKPVFLVKYKVKNGLEYDCANELVARGANYISSSSALNKVKETIGPAYDIVINSLII